METELLRLALFFRFFLLRECLNLLDALIAFFFRLPILVRLSSSEFSKSDFRSFLSSWLENPSKPKETERKILVKRYSNQYLPYKFVHGGHWSPRSKYSLKQNLNFRFSEFFLWLHCQAANIDNCVPPNLPNYTQVKFSTRLDCNKISGGAYEPE